MGQPRPEISITPVNLAGPKTHILILMRWPAPALRTKNISELQWYDCALTFSRRRHTAGCFAHILLAHIKTLKAEPKLSSTRSYGRW